MYPEMDLLEWRAAGAYAFAFLAALLTLSVAAYMWWRRSKAWPALVLSIAALCPVADTLTTIGDFLFLARFGYPDQPDSRVVHLLPGWNAVWPYASIMFCLLIAIGQVLAIVGAVGWCRLLLREPAQAGGARIDHDATTGTT